MPADRPDGDESKESGEVLEEGGSVGAEMKSEQRSAQPMEDPRQGNGAIHNTSVCSLRAS